MLAEEAGAAPAPLLRPFVSGYMGYHYRGFSPGVHLGMPSTALTVVLSLGEPTRVTYDAAGPYPGFQALASGLDTKPAYIRHDGTQFGVQLDLTPAGARALLGVPASALSGTVVPLADLLGPCADELLERVAAAPSWSRRFALLDEVLLRRAGSRRPAEDTVDAAWRLMVGSRGSMRVGELADRIGWSRRHLSTVFRNEFGVGPKDLGRVARFERSRALLRRGGVTGLGDLAVLCGYYDQAHMARDWRLLAGVAPSVWMAEERLPILPSAHGA